MPVSAGKPAPSLARIDALERFLAGRNEVVVDLFGSEWLDAFAARASLAAADLMRDALAVPLQSDVPAAARVLWFRYPTLVSGDGFGWSRLGLKRPWRRLRFSIDPTVSCSDSMLASFRRALGVELDERGAAGEADGDASVTVRDLRCTTSDNTLETKTVASTRASGTRQDANPVYVSLQTQLAAAQADLDRLMARLSVPAAPNDLSRSMEIALAIRQRQLVNSLSSQLASTPPFLYVPISVPYTFVETVVERRVSVDASIEASDRRTGFVTGDTLAFALTAQSTARAGVLDGDLSRRSNTDVVLPAPQDLIVEAIKRESAKIMSTVASVAQQLFLARVSHAAKTGGSATEALGNVLFARDFVEALPDGFAEASTVSAFERLDTLALWRQKLASPKTVAAKGIAAVPAKADVGSRAVTPSSRTAVIQKVLRSVVTVQTTLGTGSGFFISGAGLILTNAHVVSGAAKIVVRTQLGETYLAKSIRCIDEKDIALVQIAATGYAALEIGNSSAIEVGTDVMTVGSPAGLTGTVTRGIISAKRRWSGLGLLQIDAAINPGNSGGPLLTEDGKVVGINTMKLAPEKLESLGFAIAIDDVMAEIGRYLKGP